MADIKTPVGNAPVIPLILLGTGFYLAWFAIHYWGSDETWPTTPIKQVLTGKAIDTPTGNQTAAQVAANVEVGGSSVMPAAGTVPPGSGSGASTGIHPVATGTAAANQAIAKLVAAAYGWAPTQSPDNWNALVQMWDGESSWDNNATNPGSKAYGIAQAYGHGNGSATQGSVSNMYGGYGISDAMARAANSGDPTSQITWGLQYIKLTPGYGSPSAAYSAWLSRNPHWY